MLQNQRTADVEVWFINFKEISWQADSKLLVQNLVTFIFTMTVTVKGNTHGIKIILGIPLKSAKQQFTLYKLIAMPQRLSKDKFIKYLPEFSYFGLSVSWWDFILLTADLMQCTTGRITVCPINTALYDVQSPTCEAKLFFQTTGNYSPYRRRLLQHYSTPILQRHGTVWVYHFPVRRQFTIRCPNGKDWRIYNEVLSWAGVIHNATACSIASSEIRTLSELHGSAYTKLDTPSLYLPDVSPILEVHKLPQLQEAFPMEARELDTLRTYLQTQERSYDLDTLPQLRQTPPLR